MTLRLSFLITITSFFNVFGQNKFPQGYFIMPINPGSPVSLSGAFADIRTNHFHAGLDIRTGGTEGKLVYAAAEGYVSRIKIQNGGYGNALYITHPNGYTTVYAHLKTLNDTLQKYLVQNQYDQRSFEIDVKVPIGLFTVRKGEMVALSGNTGGSAGPHLHFEIRDAEENILDPSQFGFYELRDVAPPVIEFVSLKTMGENARINGKFGIFNFPVVRQKNGLYAINQVIMAKGLIAMEIYTYDKTSNSPFRQGVNNINVRINNTEVYDFKADAFAFHNKLDMNCHVNYEKLIKKGQKVHRCYLVPGNTLSNYKTNEYNGAFEINNEFNNVDIRVFDSFKNNVGLYFNIQKEKDDFLPDAKISDLTKINILDNYLSIETPKFSSGNLPLKFTIDQSEKNYELIGDSAKMHTFVYNLNQGIPSQILVNNSYFNVPINFNFNRENPRFQNNNISANMSGALYGNDFVNIKTQEQRIQIHDDVLPLKSMANISWTKTNPINYPDKYKVYIDERKPKFLGGEWTGNTINFKTKEYGTFITLYDFEPPTITTRILNNDKIIFKIADPLSGISKIECMIENQWILMNYEYKSGIIWAERLDKTKPFEGNLVLTVSDNCGNSQTFSNYITPKI